jgi:DNA polymerase III epsilon subunit family exonuclease
MLLRTDLRYVVFDVETTGLDKKHDEIIQIGLVEYDASGQKVREFSSYVKPPATEKIADMVQMITGITIDHILNAPSWSEIADEVAMFWGETTVIVGHSVHFDMAFVERLMHVPHYAQIDTLPLAQATIPYAPSYALEILAQNHLAPEVKAAAIGGKVSWQGGFHDALVDAKITGELFFVLVKKCESLFYVFPYLWEVSKRTLTGLPTCFHYDADARHLLSTLPRLETYTMQSTKPLAEPLPPGTRYTGCAHLHDVVKHIPLSTAVIGCSHHPKATMLQKEAASFGMTTSIYDQTFLDHDLLQRFFTQTMFHDHERYCAIKYIMHTSQHHGSYHAVNHHDHRRVRALQITTPVASSRRIYQHHQLFQACEDGLISHDTQIVLMDKERLFNNRQKRKYGPTELYHLADQLEATIYKYMLWGRDTQKRERFLAAVSIFLGVWEGSCRQLFADMRWSPRGKGEAPHSTRRASDTSEGKQMPHTHITKNTVSSKDAWETLRIDDFFSTTYFGRAASLWENMRQHIEICFHEYEVGDTTRIDHIRTQIDMRLHQPITIIHKRAHHDDRYQIEPVDTYTAWDDIMQFFAEYDLTIISVLDTKIPVCPWLPESLVPAPLLKRKHMVVSDTPRLCLLAPSKRAAQELFMWLHKSKAYADTFLGAENITGGTGKIIQQLRNKNSYILIGGYAFALQCIAQWVKFDSIGALDILETSNILTFMDITYYAGTQKQ